MPLHDPRKYLHDMLESCEFLLDFTHGKTVNDYVTDRSFRSALERERQIIGEAMIMLEKTSPEIAERISEYQNIIGFRHVLVHGYSSLNPATVWNVVETKLDKLAQELRPLLNNILPLD